MLHYYPIIQYINVHTFAVISHIFAFAKKIIGTDSMNIL